MELPLEERLQRRIIDGEKNGLEADLDAAMAEGSKPLAIVNDTLLSGMKVVGELFGSGEMQLPFVLQSAEVMKTAVAHLEPHMEKVEGQEGKGKIVLATVKGDVHDIGKNLVDIILTNNGYTVINLGIKQPVSAILDAAQEHDVDVVGMSGLLVKSTVVMKENLLEMNSRGIASTYPVILGGAALTRAYVEQDLDEVYEGDVKYARDAFEGLRLMDELMAVKRGAVAPEVSAERAGQGRRAPGPARPLARHRRSRARRRRRSSSRSAAPTSRPTTACPSRRSGARGCPRASRWPTTPPGSTSGRCSSGSGACAARAAAPARRTRSSSRPRAGRGCARCSAQVQAEGIMQAAVVHGYFPAVSKGDDLIVLDPSTGDERAASPSRGSGATGTCAWPTSGGRRSRGETDVVAFQVVTMGRRVSEVTAEMFARNAYREYLELHGLSVQLTEALAEYWHARVRAELGFGDEDAARPVAASSSSSTAARATPGATRPAPTSRTRPRSPELLEWERIGVELSEEFQLHAGAVDVGDHRAPPRGEVLRGAVTSAGPRGPPPAGPSPGHPSWTVMSSYSQSLLSDRIHRKPDSSLKGESVSTASSIGLPVPSALCQ